MAIASGKNFAFVVMITRWRHRACQQSTTLLQVLTQLEVVCAPVTRGCVSHVCLHDCREGGRTLFCLLALQQALSRMRVTPAWP